MDPFRLDSTIAVRIACHHLKPGPEIVGLRKRGLAEGTLLLNVIEVIYMTGCFKRISALASAV